MKKLFLIFCFCGLILTGCDSDYVAENIDESLEREADKLPDVVYQTEEPEDEDVPVSSTSPKPSASKIKLKVDKLLLTKKIDGFMFTTSEEIDGAIVYKFIANSICTLVVKQYRNNDYSVVMSSQSYVSDDVNVKDGIAVFIGRDKNNINSAYWHNNEYTITANLSNSVRNEDTFKNILEDAIK